MSTFTTTTTATASDLRSAHELAFSNAPETLSPIPLPVRGNLPPWLTGVLYRTGPGTYDIPSSSPSAKGGEVHIQHWFDGLGLNHRFSISSKGVEYSARKSSHAVEEEISRAGKVVGISFGQQDPCEGLFHKYFTTFRRLTGTEGGNARTHQLPDGANVAVTLSPDMPGFPEQLIPDRLLAREPKAGEGPKYLVAKTDATLLQLLDPDTLEPLAITTYAGVSLELDGQMAAAHGCTDPRTGEYYNFSLKFGPRPVYKIFRAAPGQKGVKVLAEVRDAPLAYIHSFAMTGRYVVLCVWASEITSGGLSVLYNGNFAQSISTHPTRPSTFYVIDRHAGGLVAKYTTPPFFAFHHMNAYDDPVSGDVLIDLPFYKDAGLIQRFYVDELRKGFPKESQGQARRYRLSDPSAPGPAPPAAREAKVDWTASAWLELPTIRPDLAGRPYRYAYGMSKTGDSPRFADSLVKLDVGCNPPTAKYWHGTDGQTPGEPIFVPRPGGKEEDDGVVLSVVLDGLGKRSFLLVLDGRSFEEIARAEAPEGKWVAAGFHGAFV
ncbi:carotenoid oxygenase [Calocera viscosa TUFC12733]|uniref:Carotenoid oxygenase n=1 Tax=Calocera viscosa (strain TUFC12733) TaxID=1330018 RepID=A0A167LGS9_CALVF|nr:carotenoid oxygenase [Calocera viscosa TUFC12733]